MPVQRMAVTHASWGTGKPVPVPLMSVTHPPGSIPVPVRCCALASLLPVVGALGVLPVASFRAPPCTRLPLSPTCPSSVAPPLVLTPEASGFSLWPLYRIMQGLAPGRNERVLHGLVQQTVPCLPVTSAFLAGSLPCVPSICVPNHFARKLWLCHRAEMTPPLGASPQRQTPVCVTTSGALYTARGLLRRWAWFRSALRRLCPFPLLWNEQWTGRPGASSPRARASWIPPCDMRKGGSAKSTQTLGSLSAWA